MASDDGSLDDEDAVPATRESFAMANHSIRGVPRDRSMRMRAGFREDHFDVVFAMANEWNHL